MAVDTPRRHVIKRSSFARLYDTTTAAYVDVAQLRSLSRTGTGVVVVDAKSGKDITSAFRMIDPDPTN